MKILITGMSGTGKTSVLEELARRGWDVVDSDDPAWKVPDHLGDMVWDAEAITTLLNAPRDRRPLAVQGTVSNQGRFYDLFDAVVCLVAPIEVMLERVSLRTNNPYGKSAAEWAEIVANRERFQEALMRGADLVIDTGDITIAHVADRVIAYLSRPTHDS